jgi:hypothetical protein
MKPTYSIVLFSLSLMVLISTFKHYSERQKTSAKVLLATSNSTRMINNRINLTNQMSIDFFEYSVIKNPEFETLFNQLKTISKINYDFKHSLNAFHSELFSIENPFYTIGKNEPIQFQESTFIFPSNSRKATKAIIQKNAAQLNVSYLDFIKKIEAVFEDTSLFNPMNRRDLQILRYENLAILDSLKQKIKYSETVESIQNHYSKFDFLQLQLQLPLVKQDCLIFENAIINNFKNTKRNIRSSSIYQQKYTLINYSEDRPTIGEDYELNVFLSNYVTNEDIQMRVNGKQIPVKNGIGYYESKKGKSFKVDISLINQMTSRRDGFSKTFKR